MKKLSLVVGVEVGLVNNGRSPLFNMYFMINLRDLGSVSTDSRVLHFPLVCLKRLLSYPDDYILGHGGLFPLP